MKFSDKVKMRYEEMKIRNSVKFSNMVIRDLQLGIDPNGFIYAPGILDPVTRSPEQFTFNGYRYVEYTDRGIAITEEDSNIRLFDPYNNGALMLNCLLWFMTNGKDIDVNNNVASVFITNSKMNDIGHSEIRLLPEADLSKYIGIPEFNRETLSITGHDYIRDCLKYYDMIMILDNTLPYVFYSEDIKSVDMVPFDVYFNREMAIHQKELDRKNHIKLREPITFNRRENNK